MSEIIIPERKIVQNRGNNKNYPKVHADALFNFNSQLNSILDAITTRQFTASYCVEDISYLRIPGLKKLAIPMKCFCDINFR